jgi:hypothetical protein
VLILLSYFLTDIAVDSRLRLVDTIKSQMNRNGDAILI